MTAAKRDALGIQVDPAFEREARALSGEEWVELERALLAEGCRDPLVVSEGVLLDGHHRYRLCQEHRIPFGVVEVDPREALGEPDLEWRDACLIWIQRNQRSRRNLSDLQWKLSVGREWNVRKAGRGRPAKDENTQTVRLSEFAEASGLGERTVQNYGEFADAVDELSEEAPNLVAQIESPDSRWHPKQVVELARAEDRDELVKTLVSGEADSFQHAKNKVRKKDRERAEGKEEKSEEPAASDLEGQAKHLAESFSRIDRIASHLQTEVSEFQRQLERTPGGAVSGIGAWAVVKRVELLGTQLREFAASLRSRGGEKTA